MLSELPLEILRRICTELPPEAALCFAHSCRQTYHSCDDWIIWRSIVKESARVLPKPPAARVAQPCEEARHKMANAAIIGTGAEVRRMNVVEQYMSQLMVLGCRCCERQEADQELTGTEQIQWQHL